MNANINHDWLRYLGTEHGGRRAYSSHPQRSRQQISGGNIGQYLHYAQWLAYSINCPCDLDTGRTLHLDAWSEGYGYALTCNNSVWRRSFQPGTANSAPSPPPPSSHWWLTAICDQPERGGGYLYWGLQRGKACLPKTKTEKNMSIPGLRRMFPINIVWILVMFLGCEEFHTGFCCCIHVCCFSSRERPQQIVAVGNLAVSWKRVIGIVDSALLGVTAAAAGR